MTDGLRIVHLGIAQQVANPKVGNPEGIHSMCYPLDAATISILNTI